MSRSLCSFGALAAAVASFAAPGVAFAATPSPHSSSLIVARQVLASRAAAALSAPPTVATVDAVAAACTPVPCVIPDSQASAGPQPVNEDAMTVNPLDPQVLVTSGNDYNCPSLQGIFSSSDQGLTWRRTCMTALPGNSGLGDPVPAFDAAGVAYIVGINSPDGGATGTVVIQRSTDNGVTWGAARRAVPNRLGGIADKPWLEVDTSAASPRRNALYVSATQFDSSSDSQITVSNSRDGGATWTTVNASTFHAFPEVAQFSDLAVGRDGTVYLSYMICTANGPTGDCGGTTARMVMQKSADGGTTWSTPVTMATVNMAADSCGAFYGCLANTSERVSNIPAIAVDNSTGPRSGRLYAVMTNLVQRVLRVDFVSSADGGATWSVPKAVVAFGTPGDEFFPWLNVGPTGVVGVTWLDRRNDPANVSYEAFAAVSTNGGRSFTSSLKLSSAPSNPFNDGFGGGFMGDYTGNAWVGGELLMSYMDTRVGVAQDFVVGAHR